VTLRIVPVRQSYNCCINGDTKNVALNNKAITVYDVTIDLRMT